MFYISHGFAHNPTIEYYYDDYGGYILSMAESIDEHNPHDVVKSYSIFTKRMGMHRMSTTTIGGEP